MENGGLLIDNPGTREVGMVDSSSIETVFDEIENLASDCKFSDCSHMQEPGCAVKKAVDEKVLDGYRYNNYVKLKKESEFYKMTDLEKREKDRKFGKFIKKNTPRVKALK